MNDEGVLSTSSEGCLLTLQRGAFPALALSEQEHLDLPATFGLCFKSLLLLSQLLIDSITDFFSLPFLLQAQFALLWGLTWRRREDGGEGVRDASFRFYNGRHWRH